MGHIIMNITSSALFLAIVIAFWLFLLYYSILAVLGTWYRIETLTTKPHRPSEWPSVDILIPAYNEGKVLADTLNAMASLEYEGPLNIYVLNDSSTDDTGEIADYYASLFPHIHHIKVPQGEPKGKARVLNYGLSLTKGEMVVIYDADNMPEKDAVKYLVMKALENDRYAGAVGYYKSYNMYKNNLTTMIGLEILLYQLIMQLGRWKLFKLGSFTGTNMLIKRSILEEIGGWDDYALAEDAEITLNITSRGYLIPVEPRAQTWEQEPENLRVWWKQRTRWMIGNLYLISKTLENRHYRTGKNLINAIQLLSIYYVFIFMVILSDTWFILGLLGILSVGVDLPLITLWFQSWWIYVAQLIAGAFVEREITYKSVLMAMLMYFTYAQLWLLILINAQIQIRKEARRGKKAIVWEKTARF